MKKLENSKNSLEVLKNANFERIEYDDFHLTGVIGQFDLTFEL